MLRHRRGRQDDRHTCRQCLSQACGPSWPCTAVYACETHTLTQVPLHANAHVSTALQVAIRSTHAASMFRHSMSCGTREYRPCGVRRRRRAAPNSARTCEATETEGGCIALYSVYAVLSRHHSVCRVAGTIRCGPPESWETRESVRAHVCSVVGARPCGSRLARRSVSAPRVRPRQRHIAILPLAHLTDHRRGVWKFFFVQPPLSQVRYIVFGSATACTFHPARTAVFSRMPHQPTC